MKTQVIIVGSGISGLVLSYLLKEKGVDHVVLNRVEKQKALELPETVPPSTLALLESLNLLELFSKRSSKTFGYHSLWGSGPLRTDNYLHHNPYKFVLKLNRKEVLQDLEFLVSDHLFSYNHLKELQQNDKGISVLLEFENQPISIEGNIIIDATGRNRAVLKQLDIISEFFDNQIALSCHLPYFKHPHLIHPVFIESFEHGWGIVSALNDETNVMTLYTQNGSPLQHSLKDYENWKDVLSNTKILKDFLSDSVNPAIHVGNANSSRATQITGSNWMAIGNAAIAFNPLSSHRISNVVYCANAAANAITAEDRSASFQRYDDTLGKIFEAYLSHRIGLMEDVG